MIEHSTTIRLHDTDAAGLLFYARQFYIVNDVYELFLEKIEYPVSYLLRDADFFTPIVHSEADFLAPLFPDDRLKIVMSLSQIGESSITYKYDIYNISNEKVGTVTNTHVCIDKTNKRSRKIPDQFAKNAKKILSP